MSANMEIVLTYFGDLFLALKDSCSPRWQIWFLLVQGIEDFRLCPSQNIAAPSCNCWALDAQQLKQTLIKLLPSRIFIRSCWLAGFVRNCDLDTSKVHQVGKGWPGAELRLVSCGPPNMTEPAARIPNIWPQLIRSGENCSPSKQVKGCRFPSEIIS